LKRPKQVNILGVSYELIYVDKPSDVDIHKRESLWGQIDYYRTIRIYDHGRSEEDLWETILHEILHGIAQALHLKELKGEKNHDQLDLLSLALTDVLFRNKWFEKAQTDESH